MYASVDIWVAIVLAGIAGCVATAFVANQLAGVPFNAVAGNVYKHIWSIILAIPIPLLLSLAAGVVGIVLALIWLVLSPTVLSKLYFGPKDVSWGRLSTFHAGYAVVALIVYLAVVRLV